MPEYDEIIQEFKTVSGYHEGAVYCRADLHTHSPASECSCYTLPAVLENLFPRRKDGQTAKEFHYEKYDMICILSESESNGGAASFTEAFSDTEVQSLPTLGGHPKIDHGLLSDITMAWLDHITSITDAHETESGKRKVRDKLIDMSLIDIGRYIKSCLFPEEYVLRCYIEGMSLTALTDHNHPGYIVPRVPKIGTWYSAIRSVNSRYLGEIYHDDPNRRVRQTMLNRLFYAKNALERDERVEKHRLEGKNHKQSAKKLNSLGDRIEHIEERISFWTDEDNHIRPLRLLPGLEITASNVHLLAVFPPKWYSSLRIASILGSIGIREEHWGRGFIAAASSSVQDTISIVSKEGGIVIPAHSNSDHKGLLRLFKKGVALNKVIEHPSLLALETVGGTVKLRDKGKGLNSCETLHWLDTASNRPSRSKPICFVKGSDAHEIRLEVDGTGEDIGSRFTWVKLDIRRNDTVDEVFRSLKLALLSGQSRIIEFPVEDGYNYTAGKDETYVVKKKDRSALLVSHLSGPAIIGLFVQGRGTYGNGLSLRFNPYLNCIVGSGGKSTVIRYLSYAFGLQNFLSGTSKSWLPETVRVYWHAEGSVYCTERKGRHIDPSEAETRYYLLGVDGAWAETPTVPEASIVIWPSPAEQANRNGLSSFEDELIDQLVESLAFSGNTGIGPLLINQPRDIFNNHRLFRKVLEKPYIKQRQIIWSTGSLNVPTALDAEKIFVTTEKKQGKLMELVCAGDLHEDRIREILLHEFEGGQLAFTRRANLFSI
ncbi:MAG: hypothetical protein K8S24_08400 [Candidatus Aegiribacteria sp.]|nr:hypothetical protein [Candidatus Aegiribacteria sp.]